MTRRIPTRSLFCTSTLLVTTSLWSDPTLADTLELSIAKGSWLQCEPIVGIATVHTEPDPAKVENDPNDWMVRQPIRRHLRLIVYRDESPVCSSAAFFLEFFQSPPSKQGQIYEASIFRIPLQRKTDAPRIHEYWKEPGKYLLGLVDIEHRIESNKVPIEILATPPGQEEAMRLFCAGEERVGALQMILQRHGDKEVEEAFQRLADLYPETAYGRYARTVFALREWKNFVEPQAPPTGHAGWVAMIQKLSEVSSLLEEWNPLRVEAVQALVWAEVGAGKQEDARRRLQDLQALPIPSELRAKAVQALGEIPPGPP